MKRRVRQWFMLRPCVDGYAHQSHISPIVSFELSKVLYFVYNNQ